MKGWVKLRPVLLRPRAERRGEGDVVPARLDRDGELRHLGDLQSDQRE